MHFVPGLEEPGRSAGPAWWFLFRGAKLLLAEEAPEQAAAQPAARRGGAAPLLQVPHGQAPLPPGRRHYLGTLEGEPAYAGEVEEGLTLPPGLSGVPMRGLWSALPEELFWVAGRACQVIEWERTHRYCGRCGSALVPKRGERAKECPDCGLAVFPRISPAMIVAVEKDGRILLARNRRRGLPIYSVLAGFVDPGETLEQCVHREVMEEVGIRIRNLRYFGSQPWPFPSNLMLAFTAEHASGRISIDREELLEADWYEPERLPPIPDGVTIARQMIDAFVRRQRGGRAAEAGG